MRTDKKTAIKLRQSGKSYNEISKFLHVPKSTLSTWLKNLTISVNIKKYNISKAKQIWANNIIAYNKNRAEKLRKAAIDIQLEAKEEIKKININELKLLGIALYWAEGYNRAKWNALFCNSNPSIVKIMMKFFREICKVPENKFRPQVQIHPNISKEEAENYWSQITNLDKSLFVKPLLQISKASKRRRPHNILPYGTFRVGIADSKVLYKIKGWISALSEIQ